MEQPVSRIHFRKTLYCKMVVVTLVLGATFFFALVWIYKASCSRFEEELAYHSDTLTEQICRNVDITLKELAEKTVPLTVTNNRLGPLLSTVTRRDVGKEIPFLRQSLRRTLDDLLSANYDINWMSVIDRRHEVYTVYRDTRPKDMVPDTITLLSLYMDNQENLADRPGNTVWLKSGNEDGIVLMRSVFDADTMAFCGCIIAEVQNTSLKAIFDNIDASKAGEFTLYDRNGIPLFTTGLGEDDRGRESQVPDGQTLDGRQPDDRAQDRQTRDRQTRDSRPEESEEAGNRNYLYAQYPISRGKLKITHVVDLEEKNRRFSDLLHLISGIGLLVFIMVIVFLWLMFGNMARNLKILLENIGRVSRGDFDLKPTLFKKGDEMDVLAFNIQEMAGRIKALMDQVVRDKEIQQQNQYQLLEFRYHELQSQVNPHFLFNTLESINGIAQINGDQQVSRLICMLSKFFRGNLERRKVSCELEEELEYSRNYLELCRNIYPDRVEIQWDVDENLMKVRIPTYILQPLVENSLVHGMEPVVGTCTIRITTAREEGRLVIRVWDNGQGIEQEKIERIMAGETGSRHIGLRNVMERIQMLYGVEYGISIQSEYGKYTEVSLILPMAG